MCLLCACYTAWLHCSSVPQRWAVQAYGCAACRWRHQGALLQHFPGWLLTAANVK